MIIEHSEPDDIIGWRKLPDIVVKLSKPGQIVIDKVIKSVSLFKKIINYSR